MLMMLARTILVTAAAILGGCAIWRPTPVPIRTLALAAACAVKPSTLLVFLPGSYSLPEDFIAHGFVDLVRRRHIAADILLVDAHLGYYSERSILDRLEVDVVAPARASGYGQVWLVGISIGAYGALLRSAAAPAHAGEVDGIVAIAPYLGDRRVSTSIEAAGGLAAWPAPLALPPNEVDELLWHWLQASTREPQGTTIFLGYGESDRFAFSDRLLARALPQERVFTAPGGHDWPIWEALWRQIVPALPLAVDPSCRAAEAPAPIALAGP